MDVRGRTSPPFLATGTMEGLDTSRYRRPRRRGGADEARLELLAVPGSHTTDLQKPWRRIRARAGLEDVGIHDLRH